LTFDPKPPDWTWAWLRGMVHKKQNNVADAVLSFRSVIDDRYDALRQRGFDFSKDYLVINELGWMLFQSANSERDPAKAKELLEQAGAAFRRTLELDVENLTAHSNLEQIYRQLGDSQREEEHRKRLEQYRPDEARSATVNAAAGRYRAGAHASDPIAIYVLRPPGQRGESPRQKAAAD
jgi:hypothetical protein